MSPPLPVTLRDVSTRLIILARAALYRDAWRALLGNQPEITIAGTAADAEEAHDLLAAGERTTVLIDLAIPDPAVARRLKDFDAQAGVLFLVQTYDLTEVLSLLQADAAGVISREEQTGDLARAVIAAGRGEIILPPTIAARVLGMLARGERLEGDLVEPLSARETEVLGLLARGLTNKDIAQSLMLSVRTVEAHLRSIFGKLAVGSRTEAALWAVRHGYGEDAT